MVKIFNKSNQDLNIGLLNNKSINIKKNEWSGKIDATDDEILNSLEVVNFSKTGMIIVKKENPEAIQSNKLLPKKMAKTFDKKKK